MQEKERMRAAEGAAGDGGWRQVMRGIGAGIAVMAAGMLAMALFLWLSRASRESVLWCIPAVKLAAAVVSMTVALRRCGQGRLPRALAAGGAVWGITLAAVLPAAGWKWTWIMGIDLAALTAAAVVLSLRAPASGRK